MSDERAREIANAMDDAGRRSITSDWDAFCDCDYADMSCEYDGFTDRLEAQGLIVLDAVDEDDLNDAFAWERGIEAGGSVFRLTPLGLAVRRILEETRQC